MDNEFEPIGDRLRKAREAAELDVLDVVHRTRIPKSVVIALEEGDFTVFDSPTYAKSFLSQYGEFLDVDTRAWIAAIEPASYIPDEHGSGFFRPSETRPEPVKVQKENSGSSIWSTFWVLLLSTGILAGAIYGYVVMEKKFAELTGGEPVEEAPAPPNNPEKPAPTAVENDSEDEPDPDDPPRVPRAIPVRE